MHTKNRRQAGMRQGSPTQAAAYVSDFEQFMNDFLARHPEVEEDQRRGWYIWWDHRYERDDHARLVQNDVPFKPYS